MLCGALIAVSFIATAAATSEPSEPSLIASASDIKQRVTLSDGTRIGGEVTFAGAGFAPGALISIFVTYPDGTVVPAVNVATIGKTLPCCMGKDQTFADGTGSFSFTLRFGNDIDAPRTDATPASSASTRGLSEGQVFLVRSTDTNITPPNGLYGITATGSRPFTSGTPTPLPSTPDAERDEGNPSTEDITRTATTAITILGSTRDDFSRSTTGAMTVYTTVGHKTFGKHFDFDTRLPSSFDKSDSRITAPNANVDIACNGLIPGERVTFWDTLPDGSAYWLTTIVADDGGTGFIQVELLTGGFPEGLHTFSCRGNTSNYVFSNSFLVMPGDPGFSRPPIATIQPRPTSGTKILCQTTAQSANTDTTCHPRYAEPGSTPTR